MATNSPSRPAWIKTAVIGALLGPAAVVPYACTAKLVTLLGNQPQLFMQMAVPALSELRAVSRERLFQVSTSHPPRHRTVMILPPSMKTTPVAAGNTPPVAVAPSLASRSGGS